MVGVFLIVPVASAEEASAFGFATGDVVRTLLLLGALAFVPALLMSMTAFVRIAIVLAMIRHAFGMPETPPNPVLISLSLFLTIFVMSPTFDAVRTTAINPYVQNELGLEDAAQLAQQPLKEFMLSEVQDKDVILMYELSGKTPPSSATEVDLFLLTPAFMLNELRVAFTIGFVIMLPFLLIDLIVASILLSLGMMMVPPATISLPIKLLMFVVIDGWALILRGVLGGFA